MPRRPWLLVFLLAGCTSGPSADLGYVKQARSLGAEWAMVNEQASKGRLTATYVQSMHRWLRGNLRTAAGSLRQPDSRYGAEMKALLAEPDDAPPADLRAHAEVLKQIEQGLESA